MRKFNLFKEIIHVNKNKLINAINTQKTFAIDINGDIIYEPFTNQDVLIYAGNPKITGKFTEVLGKNYQLVEDNDTVLIKAFSNWQELITLNSPRASYDDTTADGVAEFSNKDLENIGWNATEFNIKYRELVEMLEEKCDGTLLCIEQEEPYQFSGLGFLRDNDEAKKIMFEYCKNIVIDKINNDEEFAKENLTDDEMEAAEFFNVL